MLTRPDRPEPSPMELVLLPSWPTLVLLAIAMEDGKVRYVLDDDDDDDDGCLLKNPVRLLLFGVKRGEGKG